MSGQIRKLKNFNKAPIYDSIFVGYFASVVFGDDTLKISSAEVGSHVGLDVVKMKFIEGVLNEKGWRKYYRVLHSTSFHHFRYIC